MHLLEHTPAFDVESAAAVADRYFGIRASASPLPSERDQNFLLTNGAGEKFVHTIVPITDANSAQVNRLFIYSERAE